MKTLLFTALLSLSIQARAEVVTLICNDPDPRNPIGEATTQSVSLDGDQTIELLSVTPKIGQIHVEVKKADATVVWSSTPSTGIPFPVDPLVIRGPAKLTLRMSGAAGYGLASFRVTPERVDPTKTVIVLPGTNNAAHVSLISSTNLTDWAEATNGIYSGNVAKFFRISLEPGEAKK